MIVPTWYEKACATVAAAATRKELEDYYVWSYTQDTWGHGDFDVVIMVCEDAGLTPDDIPDEDVKARWLERMEEDEHDSQGDD